MKIVQATSQIGDNLTFNDIFMTMGVRLRFEALWYGFHADECTLSFRYLDWYFATSLYRIFGSCNDVALQLSISILLK